MATQIIVPSLGESVTEATVSKWFKQVGEAVAPDEPVVELETDKVTVEIPAPTGGKLESIAVAEGADVEVGAVLGAIGEGTAAAAPQPEAPPAKGNGAAAGAVEVVIPDLGESVSEGTVGKWLKSVGDAVAADEALVEIETDKVTAELPAPVAGTLSEIIIGEGADVAVGTVVARITPGAGEPAANPAAQPVAKMEAPAGAPAGAVAGKAAPLSPAVRKLVDEHGLDPAAIPATGKGGRLTKGDVLAHLAAGEAKSAASIPAVVPPRPLAAEAPPRRPDARGEEVVRMTRLRQTIARRLKQAQDTAAMLTTFNEVDMSAVMELRSEYRASFEKKHGVRLGFMSFFIKASVVALREIPTVNAEIHGDEIIYKNYYDIGVAVGGPQGLVVPVLRDADKLSFAELERVIAEFGRRAREGGLAIQDLTGGTFTISNGGVFGSLLSTPILNPPQSGILGMHKIEKRPMVVADEVAVRPMMYLALSYDHRIVDGREAVTFLVRIKENIEDPQRLLIDA